MNGEDLAFLLDEVLREWPAPTEPARPYTGTHPLLTTGRQFACEIDAAIAAAANGRRFTAVDAVCTPAKGAP